MHPKGVRLKSLRRNDSGEGGLREEVHGKGNQSVRGLPRSGVWEMTILELYTEGEGGK